MLKLPPDMLARHRAATVTPALPAPGNALGAGAEAGAASSLPEPPGAPSGVLALVPPAVANPSGGQRSAPATDRWIVGQDLAESGAGAPTLAELTLSAQPPQPDAVAQAGATEGARGPAEGDPVQGAAAAAAEEQPAAAAALPEGLTRQPRQALAPGTSLLSGMVTVRPPTIVDMHQGSKVED